MNQHSVILLIEAIERARAKIDEESWDDAVKLFRINRLLDCVIEELKSEQEK